MTRKLDYDPIAPAYDRRYVEHEFPGTEATLERFVTAGLSVLEVGCGTGHWLERMRAWGCRVSGLDPSEQMLRRAAARVPEAELARGRAESLPWPDASFDRLVCVNALHHVEGKPRFIAEAFRVLRPGGRFLSIGMDPSVRDEAWSIYDYFETTRELDRGRYPAAAEVRAWLSDAGFAECETTVAEQIRFQLPAREALARDRLAKSSTSQLALLSDEQYRRGIDRIERDAERAEAQGTPLQLICDLRLYATRASVPTLPR